MKMSDLPCTNQTCDPEETFVLATSFGRLTKPGDLILLQGALAAGKTWFARGICAGMGLTRLWEVDSPTYTVVNHYNVGQGVYHIDLFRFHDTSELDEIGFEEILASSSVKLIEWPERLGDYPLPAPDFAVRIRIDDEFCRTIDIIHKPLECFS